jgi:hypothetical protein
MNFLSMSNLIHSIFSTISLFDQKLHFFRPPNAIFDSFTIRGIDGQTKFISETNATIFIIVEKVNLPPVPSKNNTVVSVFERFPSTISLQGTDFNGDSIKVRIL